VKPTVPLFLRVAEVADFGVFCVGKRGFRLDVVPPERVLDVGRWACYGTSQTFIVFKIDNRDSKYFAVQADGHYAEFVAYCVESEQTPEAAKEIKRLKKALRAPSRPSGRDSSVTRIVWSEPDAVPRGA
jgi:hypothetical protein